MRRRCSCDDTAIIFPSSPDQAPEHRADGGKARNGRDDSENRKQELSTESKYGSGESHHHSFFVDSSSPCHRITIASGVKISLGSIAEAAAALDLARAFGLITAADQESFKSRLKLVYTQIDALP